MRSTCLRCVMKHLAQAHILSTEYALDPAAYATHRWLAAGHLAEAEDECISLYLEYAQEIRDARIRFMDRGAPIDVARLMRMGIEYMDAETPEAKGPAS